jgi:tRNA G18 (ribose-2'-O)-methylase SpoU
MCGPECKDVVEVDVARDFGVVVGNEGEGVRESVADACEGRVTIPMSQDVDSLNIGMAAGIMLHEFASRGRRRGAEAPTANI